jgi:hypothetical protein
LSFCPLASSPFLEKDVIFPYCCHNPSHNPITYPKAYFYDIVIKLLAAESGLHHHIFWSNPIMTPCLMLISPLHLIINITIKSLKHPHKVSP